MVDDLDRDAAGLGLLERPANGRIERRPSVLVDLGFQCRLEPLVRVVAAEEIGVTDKEALAIVIGVDKPGGDVVETGGTDLAGRRVEDVEAEDFDPHPPILAMDRDVRLAEDHEEVGVVCLTPQAVGKVKIIVHPRFEDGEARESG
jgi:hypothetical protein